jgi:hypothetical protein
MLATLLIVLVGILVGNAVVTAIRRLPRDGQQDDGGSGAAAGEETHADRS